MRNYGVFLQEQKTKHYTVPVSLALPLHNTNMPQKTATPYMVKTVFPQWDAAPRIPV